ncbi:MAG: head GIN domain-containing protein [Polymorphobacter sp.]
MNIRTIPAIATCLLLVAAAASTAARAEERSFPVTGFDRLASSGSADITVTTGKVPSVRVEASKDTLDRLDIRVDGSTLRIGMKKNIWGNWNSGDIKIAVTVPMLRSVDLAGSGSLTVDRIKVPEFSASISGSGEASLPSLDADKVKLSIAGSGEFDAAGRCGDAHVNISGSGDVRIAKLQCATLHASIAGSGDLDAYATATANISVAGSGDVRVRGGAKCSTSKAGSGTVTCN